MSNNYRRGYRAEKKVADLVGGKRLGILGKEDVEHHQFSFEVKMRKVLPKFLKNCYEQASKNCPENRLPVVILKEKGKRYEDCLVIINFKDFIGCVVKKEET